MQKMKPSSITSRKKRSRCAAPTHRDMRRTTAVVLWAQQTRTSKRPGGDAGDKTMSSVSSRMLPRGRPRGPATSTASRSAASSFTVQRERSSGSIKVWCQVMVQLVLAWPPLTAATAAEADVRGAMSEFVDRKWCEPESSGESNSSSEASKLASATGAGRCHLGNVPLMVWHKSGLRTVCAARASGFATMENCLASKCSQSLAKVFLFC
mmetsp:Transcript_40962/g.87248  ORF Transcript_40962/g.87248 Transcript_40962/m.87248 type:complete len:209 (-) Transcript_40962:2546-3172(-)